jgi:hypothetical protein
LFDFRALPRLRLGRLAWARATQENEMQIGSSVVAVGFCTIMIIYGWFNGMMG